MHQGDIEQILQRCGLVPLITPGNAGIKMWRIGQQIEIDDVGSG
ncbi:hypothetical protein [Gibbsiella dentisursi]